MKNKRIGDTVVFYPEGQRNQRPSPAMVCATHKGNILDLTEIPFIASSRYRRNVYHADDERLEGNEKLKKSWGCWEEVGVYEKRIAEEDRVKEEARKAAMKKMEENPEHDLEVFAEPDEIESRVMSLIRLEGTEPGSFKRVAERMGGTWTAQWVGVTHRKFKHLIEGEAVT